MSVVPSKSGFANGSRGLAAAIATLVAIALLIWAVALAARTLEPWGDSPRAVYAVVADLLLGLGSVSLAAAMSALRRRGSLMGLGGRWEPLVYAASCLAVVAPLAIAATNSYEASALGEGGPSVAVVVVGGVGLAAGLAALMRRRITLGLTVSLVLAAVLLVVALTTAR